MTSKPRLLVHGDFVDLTDDEPIALDPPTPSVPARGRPCSMDEDKQLEQPSVKTQAITKRKIKYKEVTIMPKRPTLSAQNAGNTKSVVILDNKTIVPNPALKSASISPAAHKKNPLEKAHVGDRSAVVATPSKEIISLIRQVPGPVETSLPNSKQTDGRTKQLDGMPPHPPSVKSPERIYGTATIIKKPRPVVTHPNGSIMHQTDNKFGKSQPTEPEVATASHGVEILGQRKTSLITEPMVLNKYVSIPFPNKVVPLKSKKSPQLVKKILKRPNKPPKLHWLHNISNQHSPQPKKNAATVIYKPPTPPKIPEPVNKDTVTENTKQSAPDINTDIPATLIYKEPTPVVYKTPSPPKISEATNKDTITEIMPQSIPILDTNIPATLVTDSQGSSEVYVSLHSILNHLSTGKPLVLPPENRAFSSPSVNSNAEMIAQGAPVSNEPHVDHQFQVNQDGSLTILQPIVNPGLPKIIRKKASPKTDLAPVALSKVVSISPTIKKQVAKTIVTTPSSSKKVVVNKPSYDHDNLSSSSELEKIARLFGLSCVPAKTDELISPKEVVDATESQQQGDGPLVTKSTEKPKVQSSVVENTVSDDPLFVDLTSSDSVPADGHRRRPPVTLKHVDISAILNRHDGDEQHAQIDNVSSQSVNDARNDHMMDRCKAYISRNRDPLGDPLEKGFNTIERERKPACYVIIRDMLQEEEKRLTAARIRLRILNEAIETVYLETSQESFIPEVTLKEEMCDQSDEEVPLLSDIISSVDLEMRLFNGNDRQVTCDARENPRRGLALIKQGLEMMRSWTRNKKTDVEPPKQRKRLNEQMLGAAPGQSSHPLNQFARPKTPEIKKVFRKRQSFSPVAASTSKVAKRVETDDIVYSIAPHGVTQPAKRRKEPPVSPLELHYKQAIQSNSSNMKNLNKPVTVVIDGTHAQPFIQRISGGKRLSQGTIIGEQVAPIIKRKRVRKSNKVIANEEPSEDLLIVKQVDVLNQNYEVVSSTSFSK